MYTEVAGASECTRCPAGKFNPTPGQQKCLDCDIGTYSDHAGAEAW